MQTSLNLHTVVVLERSPAPVSLMNLPLRVVRVSGVSGDPVSVGRQTFNQSAGVGRVSGGFGRVVQAEDA